MSGSPPSTPAVPNGHLRELWGRIAGTSGAKIYGLVLGVASLSLTSRLLGPAGRGEVAALTTWVGAFMTFGYLSLGQVAMHRLAGEEGRARYSPILGSLLLLALIITGCGWTVALAVRLAWPGGPLSAFSASTLLLAFLALPFMVWDQFGGALFMALERLGVANRNQILGGTLALAAVFLFVGALGWSVPGVLAASLVGQVAIAAMGLPVLLREARERGRDPLPSRTEVRALLLGGLKLHVNAIGTFFFTSANVLLLHRYCGPRETGLFQLANQLAGILLIIPQSAGMVLYGRVVQAGPNAAWKTHRRLMAQVLAVMLVIGAIAALLAPLGIRLVAGPAFERSVPLFRILLLTIPGASLATLMAPQWIGRGYFGFTASLTLALGVVSLMANIFFIRHFGATGAVHAAIFTYAISLISNGLMWRHCDRLSRES